MAKVIFSRKGFDSSYGGGASPIMPNGDLISIPIPTKVGNGEKGIPYSEISYGDKSYLELMKELELKIPEGATCHFDPDLIKDACSRGDNWRGIFGQQGSAQTHLENQNLEKGDIFLFFGSFKRTLLKEKIQFERDYERHIIFGYLIIGEILKVGDSESSIFKKHPHFQNRKLYSKQNAVYIAASDEDYGTFKYRKELVLTREGFSKSIWELPMIFHPSRSTLISRHSEKDIDTRGEKLILNSRGIGQDFVVKGNGDIEAWAKNLIRNSKRINPTSGNTQNDNGH